MSTGHGIKTGQVQFGLLMKLCELIYHALLPDQEEGRFRFADILEDEVKMSNIFEEFVRRFYKLEQQEFLIPGRDLTWDLDEESADIDFLPTMRTDTWLRSRNRTIIIDTKFYRRVLPENQYGKPRVNRDHLFQMFAYLKNLERRNPPDNTAEGILLYASVGEPVDLRYKIQSHKVRIYAVDLDRDWRQIHDDLLALLEPWEAAVTEVA